MGVKKMEQHRETEGLLSTFDLDDQGKSFEEVIF